MRRRQGKLGGEQVAVGVDDIEIGGIADTVAGEGDGIGLALGDDLVLLRRLKFLEFLTGDQGIGHFLEGYLQALLVLQEGGALLGIGKVDLVETALRIEQRL